MPKFATHNSLHFNNQETRSYPVFSGRWHLFSWRRNCRWFVIITITKARHWTIILAHFNLNIWDVGLSISSERVFVTQIRSNRRSESRWCGTPECMLSGEPRWCRTPDCLLNSFSLTIKVLSEYRGSSLFTHPKKRFPTLADVLHAWA